MCETKINVLHDETITLATMSSRDFLMNTNLIQTKVLHD